VHQIWKGIIERCYSETNPSYYTYGAKGVEVCEYWHNFQNFAEWYQNHAVYDTNISLQIDKDILFPDSNTYSPETCVAVSSYINNLVRKHPKSDMLMGVSKSSKASKFQASIKSDKGYTGLGSFTSETEAHKAWQKAKINRLLEVLDRYRKEVFYRCEVEDALLKLVNEIESDLMFGRVTTKFYQEG
jgi:hypothetical protein